jgi:hypothetical protein
MIPPDYIQAAYLKAIAEQVARDVKDEYVDGDSPAKSAIVCEEVFHADREVTQSALLEFLGILQQISDKADKRMAKYQFTKRAPAMKVTLPAPKGDDHGE